MWEMIKVLLWFLNPRTSLHQKTYLTVPSKMEILRESCTMYKLDKLSARIARVTFPSPHLLTLVTKLENFVSVLIVCQLWGLQYHVVWREFQNCLLFIQSCKIIASLHVSVNIFWGHFLRREFFWSSYWSGCFTGWLVISDGIEKRGICRGKRRKNRELLMRTNLKSSRIKRVCTRDAQRLFFFFKCVLAYTKRYNTCSTRFVTLLYGFLANTLIPIVFWVYPTFFFIFIAAHSGPQEHSYVKD